MIQWLFDLHGKGKEGGRKGLLPGFRRSANNDNTKLRTLR